MTSPRFIEHEHGIHLAVTPHATARVRESIGEPVLHRFYWRVDGIDPAGVPFGFDAGYEIDLEAALEAATVALDACEADR